MTYEYVLVCMWPQLLTERTCSMLFSIPVSRECGRSCLLCSCCPFKNLRERESHDSHNSPSFAPRSLRDRLHLATAFAAGRWRSGCSPQLTKSSGKTKPPRRRQLRGLPRTRGRHALVGSVYWSKISSKRSNPPFEQFSTFGNVRLAL